MAEDDVPGGPPGGGAAPVVGPRWPWVALFAMSMTMEWEGGWILGIAGAPVGAAFGWLFNRWIMPEYDKRRERGSAVRPPGSSDGPGLCRSGGS